MLPPLLVCALATEQAKQPWSFSTTAVRDDVCPLGHGDCQENDSLQCKGYDAKHPRGAVLLQSASNVVFRLSTWGQAVGSHAVEDDDDVTSHKKPRSVAMGQRNNLTCHSRVYASQIEPGTTCPDRCPFWAGEVGDKLCQFQCVSSSECGTLDPNATVADQKGMFCRACIVPGCDQCNIGGGGDLCLRCREGYTFDKGHCLSPYRYAWYTLYTVIVLILVYLIWWYSDLRSRDITNEAGLEQGLRFRSRTRLHRRQEGEDGLVRQLWPLSTNLLREQVAGPGLCLFFNYQLAVTIWAACMGIGWLMLSFFVSTDLMTLGTKKAATPQQLCTVTTWGFKTQHGLMWAKVLFMCIAYIGTFLASIIFAVAQHRRFGSMDDDATMKDYAALVSKLPIARGDDPEVEEDLRLGLQKATGEEIVGVCICWNFADKEDEIMKIIEEDTEKTQRQRPSFSKHVSPLRFRPDTQEEPSIAEGSAASYAASRTSWNPVVTLARMSFDALNRLLGFQQAEQHLLRSRPTNSSLDQDIMKKRMRRGGQTSIRQVDILEGLFSTGKAFAVFPSEEARDKAVDICRRKQMLRLSGDDSSDSEDESEATCQLQEVTFEPETVNWAYFSVQSHHSVLRLLFGIVGIAAALILWTLCCYLPYALYVTSFSYARGERPTMMATMMFTLLVVLGNQTMFLVCRAVSEFARFRCRDTTEMTYLTLYFLACLVNFGMDMAVTSYVTYVMMVGMGARTSGGVPLEELTALQIFESYPMQRALGHFFFWYAFPSCFLVPFLVEPLLAIWLPGHIMELLVRSHPKVRGMEAERSLQYFSPMDLSRYSDCLLNVTIAVVSFLFPGSYVWKMFLALFASHIYIFGLDHYRVLRAVPACHFSTDACEQCVQALTAIPLGILAACIVLKYHSQESAIRLSDQQVMCTMLAAFSLHVFVHWLILFWIVPMCRRDHEDTPVDYATVSRETPCSWFSANPVHCLRSRYIHRHDPPCDHYFLGKEHLLKRNPKIGIYFESDAAAVSPRKEEGGRRAMDYWWMGHRRTSDASDDGGAVRADWSIGSSSWHRSGTSQGLAAWLSPGSFTQTTPAREAEQAVEVEGQEQLLPAAEESRLPEEGAGSAGSGQEARGS